MSRHFVISTGPCTDVDEQAIIDHLKSLKVGWWHWTPYVWLVVDGSDKFTPQELRNDMNLIVHDLRCIVLQVKPVTWAGRGPTKPRSMFSWIRNDWSSGDT